MKAQKVKALVPMKEYSERVPNKNIRPLAGKPACYWVLESLFAAKYIDEVIINTDSEKIADIVREKFDVTILMRPDYLRGDEVSIQPLIEYDLSQSDGEYYLQTHSTNPCVKPETFDQAVETYFDNLDLHDAVFAVTEIKQRFYWPDGRAINHDPKNLIQTQLLEPIYHENSCFYIFSRETNKKEKNRLGSNPLMFPIDPLEATDIDEKEDFFWAEFLLQQRIKNGI